VDSTQTVERLGDDEAAELWSLHDRRARELLVAHQGQEIDRTDGFFLLFERADAAAAYALAYHDITTQLGLKARVGIHIGSVHLRANPQDDVARGAKPLEVEGLAKPFAARIMALASGGQTLLSAEAHAALTANSFNGVESERHGHYRLKGIESPVAVYEIGRRGVSPFIPPPDSEKAYQVFHYGELWRPVREVRHNLPAERDRFVGRFSELGSLAARLDAGTRLLTVVGTGGAGKTRLVGRYGWSWMGDWPGGIYFCDLSDCRSLEGIWFAVASALEVPLGRDPNMQLGYAMAGRGRCLIILDNFEQVIEHASATVGTWLDRAINATFLVTSREQLHLKGEVLLPLDSLRLGTESVDLFKERATAQRPDFELTEANLRAVSEIVRLLEGLPLAIELAAARVSVLSLVQLLARLKDRFQILVSTQGRAARQATLHNAIDWSWGLLAPSEQSALAQCSVFEGGFTLSAAEAVLDLGEFVPAVSVLDIVQALVDKSLLRNIASVERDRFDLDEPYFGMYVSIREFAREKLRANAVRERAAEDRHGGYFARFGTDDEIEALSQHAGALRRRALTLEIDNLVSACRRAILRKQLTSAVRAYRAAWEVLELQGPVTLAATLGRELVSLPELQGRLLLLALMTVGLPLLRAGQMDEAKVVLERALSLSRHLSDRRMEGRTLGQLGTLHLDQGQIEQARQELEAALAIHRAERDRRAEGAVLGNLGNLYFDQGLLSEARQQYEAALVVNREIGNRRVEGSVLGNLGLLHFEQGRLKEARSHYEDALIIHREVGSRRLEGTVLGNLGLLHFEQGDSDEARTQDEAALRIHRAVGNRRDEGIVLANLGEAHFARGAWLDAKDCYRMALAIARELGYLRLEGSVLGSLSELLATQGRLDEARESLNAGEELLRKLGDRLDLGKLLCIRVRVELADQEPDKARLSLLEAESIAAAANAGPESELGSKVAELRAKLT
jgi:predicted ATPase/Tfp pilus assembly protein PilF